MNDNALLRVGDYRHGDSGFLLSLFGTRPKVSAAIFATPAAVYYCK